MRRTLFIIACILSLPASAAAFTCTPGSYKGKTSSVNAELHDKAATLTVAQKGDACLMRFSSPGAELEESWEVSGNKLTQRDLNAKGKELRKYGATLDVRNGTEGYYINCKEKGKCDAGVDARYFWQIQTPKSQVIYSVWGVPFKERHDPKAKVRKRHQYSFNLVP